MTQITGKIYQQTNAAGTENRFPRTVMEAVLGLNSYLQDQFGALADIYMPIEGISESKPNQEFVFRKTPNTIKAKALTLDKIKGKTLAWNQQINMSALTTKTESGITVSYENGRIHVSGTASTDFDIRIPDVVGLFVNGHKYYLKSTGATNCWVAVDSAGYPTFTNNGNISELVSPQQSIYISGHAGTFDEYITLNAIDLTIMFGAGNEPSTVAEFEALYPGYHVYNPGALISNDAESLETVGFNQWDEEWEVGEYNSSGKPNPASCIRSKNYYPVIGGKTYRFTGGNGVICCYDINKTFIPYTGQTGSNVWQNAIDVNNTTFVLPSNTAYIRFYMNSAYGTTYNHDICINISDPTRNGQYEPYKKSVMPLNLKKIRVISPNVWDEEVSTKVISSVTGEQEGNDGVCVSSLNHIPILPSTVYYIKCIYNGNNGIYIKQFDADLNPLSSGWDFSNISNTTITTAANARYIKFMTLGSYGTTYLHDICINKSDPGFNGKYFPHGILTITTGLNGVGDSYDSVEKGMMHKRRARVNLGDLTWYAAGSGQYGGYFYSYIYPGSTAGICSKYPLNLSFFDSPYPDKCFIPYPPFSAICVRDSSFNGDAGDFKAAMDGVYLDYELSNEEVYDLAEPLPTSMPSGTTEARISPNADGLSAPFCADITYGMGATEYAETAGVASFALNTQYTEVAARLLAPRTIWGQVFDGSANITGAMTGVSSIDSLMYFDTSNGRIGIGISTPLYNLDVAGTFHAAGNAEFDGTIDAVYGRSLLHSIESSPVEWDTEASPVLEIQPFEISEDGNAAFEMVSVRDCLRLRYYNVDEHDFSDSDVSFDGDHVSFENPLSAPRYDQPSDQRLKTNLSPVALTVEQIASAPAVEFNWVGNGQRGAGSIAQYWEEQLPYNVHRNGDLLSMEYGNIALISAIVCARKIQELEEQVKKLEAKLNV